MITITVNGITVAFKAFVGCFKLVLAILAALTAFTATSPPPSSGSTPPPPSSFPGLNCAPDDGGCLPCRLIGGCQ